MVSLLRSFGSTIRSVRAYYSRNGNVDSNCAAIAWQEIYNHIWRGVSPFTRDDISLDDYNKLCTLHTYQMNWIKNGPSLPREHYKMWEDFDELLARVKSPLLLANISNEITQLILDYMRKKLT